MHAAAPHSSSPFVDLACSCVARFRSCSQKLVVLSLVAQGLGVLAAPAAQAMLAEERPLAEQVQDADYVVRGTVTDGVPQVVPGTAFIYTDWTVAVTEAVKAPAGDPAPQRLVVRLPGGQIGDQGMWVSEMPQVQPQDELVLLLDQGPPGTTFTIVVDGAAGAFHVVTDPGTGQAVVLGEDGKSPLGDGGPPVPVAQLLQTLRGVVSGQSAP